jgi:DNA polymerase-3 subunit alpha
LSQKKTDIKFVNFHSHTTFSAFDGMGYPEDHMQNVWKNGGDAMAITDHGNMNSLAYQVEAFKKMAQEGKEFKPIFGIEAYFIPSVANWKEDYLDAKEERKKVQSTTINIEDEERKNFKNILNRRNHLVLIAQNETGLKNLFEMVSTSYRGDNYYRYPRIDYSLLRKHGDGIIAASACLSGIYSGCYWKRRDEGDEAILNEMRQTTEKMRRIFGDRWYGELQWNAIPEQHDINKYIIQVAREYDVALISTADSHYPSQDTWRDRELYRRLGWLGKSTRPGWMSQELPESIDAVGYELYPKNGDQMWQAYKRYSSQMNTSYDDKLILESIERTHHIAHERIETFLPNTDVKLPSFVVPKGYSAEQALASMCVAGLKDLGLGNEGEYVERLKEEVQVIKERGFSRYFLTMKAIADKAMDKQLVGPGRGSAAGALTAYVLGITQVDPLRYGLQFERFLRKDATDYPDIDYDVSDPMELKEHLIEEWGENSVVPISNWNTLQLRSLIKDISKFYDVPFTEVNYVTNRMFAEATPTAKKAHGIKAGVYTPTFDEVMQYSPTLQQFLQKYPQIETHVNTLYGQVRSCSRHAGGVVIAEDLNKHMPLISSGGVTQSPWTEGQHVRHLEPLGFIKFDILGLASLRMIEGAISHLLQRHHGVQQPTFEDIKGYYNKNLHPDVIDLTDQEVYKNIFHEGRWAGIFQFTEEGAQKFCVRAKPHNIVDLAAITAIYRPGPLSAGVDKQYVKAKLHPEEVEYLSEEVSQVTKETAGFLIFQEQIAELAHRLGDGITLDEGNKLRKLLTKKGVAGVEQQKNSIKDKFIRGCLSKAISKEEATHLWDTFEYFSGYGFNKSHAVSYSVLSYQCAWLLHYYPAEWMAAFLDKEPETRKEKAINIAKSLDFNIAPLDVNSSGTVWEISADGRTLIQPLTSIKGLGEAAIKQILDNRPFKKIEDFLFNENITYSKLNKKSLDALCRAQALSSLVDERFSGLKHFWSACVVDRPKNEKKFIENIDKYRPEGEFDPEELIQYLVDLTGVYPMRLVMNEALLEKLESKHIPRISEYDEELQLAWFIPRKIIPKKTKNGKDYWILEVIDDSSTMTRIRCWGIKKGRDMILTNHPYVARLEHTVDWGFSTRSIRHNFRMLT